MRKLVFALGIIVSTQSVVQQIPTLAPAQQEIHAYAKWGQFAMKETQSKYPNASIIDYLYEGSELKENTTTEKFRLWLRNSDSDREFGVSVKIEYTTETDELVNIHIEKISD
ncbi:MAG: DUF3889 domain-containing protein [Psychrobacillus psychrotolerans]